jgi:excisionase family DNA binding protein
MSKDPRLTVREVAKLWGTSERYPRRLIAERRIAFERIGRHVRIRQSVAEAMVETVEPIDRRRGPRRRRRVA